MSRPPEVVPSSIARQYLRDAAAAILCGGEPPLPPAGQFIRQSDLAASKVELIEKLSARLALIPARVSADPKVQALIRDELDAVLMRLAERAANG